MKLISTHIHTKLVFALFFSLVVSQKAISQNIPDANFAAAIRAACPACIDGSNNLLPAAAGLTSLDVSGKNISNLTGIGGFTGLQTLNCSENQLTNLPNVPSGISYLNCNQNQLTGLPALPAGLTVLSCDNNPIASLPALPGSLSLLFCQNNQLISLPVLPNNLTNLYCINNQLTTLPTLPNSLTKIECRGNQLTSLPTLPSSLAELICNANLITSLPTLPGTLTKLRIDADKITCLPNSIVGLQVYNANNILITTPPICNSCIPPVATGATICAGNSVTLTATGCTGAGKVLKWYNATTVVLVTMPVSPTTNTDYYAKCETTANGSTCVSANSNTVTVTVANLPSPVAKGATICIGKSVTLSATGCSGANYAIKWFNTALNSPVVMPITPISNTDYYAKCELTTNATTCVSAKSADVTVTVLDPQTNQVILNNNITSGTITELAGKIIATNQIFKANVEYRAYQSVILNPGFKTGDSAVFKAQIAGCSDKKHLNLVSVTKAFNTFDANSWERQYRVKETKEMNLYEVCIWDNITNPRVSLYKFDSTFSPLKSEFLLGGQAWVDYRESYNILNVYTHVISSSEYLSAFKQIFEKIVSFKDADHYGIKYNGHGTSGKTLFEGKILANDSQTLLSHIKSLIGKNIDFLDWSTNCNGGQYDAISSQYKYTDYILASDELRGGYNFNIDDYFNLRSDQNIEKFFKPTLSIRQSLIDMINSDKLFWETATTKNDMIQNKIKQSISIYDSSTFEELATAANLSENAGIYQGDILNFIKLHYPLQEQKFYDFRFHYIHNKDFFQWDKNSNGFIMY